MNWKLMILSTLGSVLFALLPALPAEGAEENQSNDGFFSSTPATFELKKISKVKEVVVVVRLQESPDHQGLVEVAQARVEDLPNDPEKIHFNHLNFSSDRQAQAFAAYYREFFDHPLQIWVPSEHGPVPLFNDVVYDERGNPKPRMPDPMTYLAMTNPTEENIAQYELQRQGALRQFRVSQSQLVPVAEKLGIVTLEALKVQEPANPEALALGDWDAIDENSRGTPILKPEQARVAGFQAADKLPVSPGPPNDIEVFWFWHQDCPWSQKHADEWMPFAASVNRAGYKAAGIVLTQDTASAAAQLKLWGIRGLETNKVINYQDNTNMRESLNVTGTPTIVFIHRPSGRILRHNEYVSEATLRATLAKVAGWPEGTWPPPSVSETLELEIQANPDDGASPRRSNLEQLLKELPNQ